MSYVYSKYISYLSVVCMQTKLAVSLLVWNPRSSDCTLWSNVQSYCLLMPM